MSVASEDEEYEIERILMDDVVEGKTFYLVKWKHYPDEQCTWEPAENFTSTLSITEWEKQKAVNDVLPYDFFVGLQKKMDLYQARLSEEDYTSNQTYDLKDVDVDKPVEPPAKRHKLANNTDGPDQTKQTFRKSDSAVVQKKGIAISRQVKATSRPLSRASRKTTSITNSRDVTASLVPVPQSAATKKAGQRFRNLSHQNNARKKAQLEPAPNLPLGRLKSITEFRLGRESANILPPSFDDTTNERDDSPLFVPEAGPNGLTKGISPALSELSDFPPAKVDHLMKHNPPRSIPGETLNTIMNESTGDPSSNAIVQSPHPFSQYEFPLSPTPSSDTIIKAKNGRWWYKGDIMCNLAVVNPIGDATIISLPFHNYGSHLVRLKAGDVLTINFERAYNKPEFEEAFINHHFKAQAIGVVQPFLDTVQAFTKFAEYLEAHDLAAVFLYPDPSVDLSLILYSMWAKSWTDIGWRSARSGKPRLHVACIPRLQRRTFVEPRSGANNQFNSLHNQEVKDISMIDNSDIRSLDIRQKTNSLKLSRKRTRSPSLSRDVVGLGIQSDDVLMSLDANSDHHKSVPGSPASAWTSCEASPISKSPSSPRIVPLPVLIQRSFSMDNDASRKPATELKQSNISSKTLDGFRKLNFQTLINSYPSMAMLKLDQRKTQFFLSFALSNPEESETLSRWLEDHTAASNIYLDSERHDWTRFRDKGTAEKIVSVLLFHEISPNYQRLLGFGEMMLTDVPTCFCVRFEKDSAGDIDISLTKTKKIFPRRSLYLITESMITQYLDETTAIVRYFDSTKRLGYKMMMRPNIERWLLEYSAKEEDNIRRDKLIDLLLLIRGLRPTSDYPAEDDLQVYDVDTPGNGSELVNNTTSYIISPQNIPGFASPVTILPSLTQDKIQTNSVADANLRDEILASYFYCYAATHATSLRRFFCFYPTGKTEEHKAMMKQKEKDKILDCGHIYFWELEKFVARFCQRSEKNETQDKSDAQRKNNI